MRTARRLLPLLLALGLTAACTQEADHDPLEGFGGLGGCSGHDLDARDLLSCLGPSVALVDTPVSGGSAVLLPGGYVVTNAHVVDPFPVADLTFADGTYLPNVDVVGIDAFADLAVLGPVEVDLPAVDLVPGDDLERGEDVFLVGFPGEVDDEPEPAISRGVLSRTRQAGTFDLTYLQTDASIGGGQSGGALVDTEGRVVGISGLSFADEFALALDGGDVQDSIDRILDGDGDPYATLPRGDDDAVATTHVVLADDVDGALLLVPFQEDDVTLRVELSVPDGIGLDATTLDGETILINQVAADLAAAVDDVDLEEIGVPVSAPVAPGVYEVEVPAGIEVALSITTSLPGPVELDVTTSIPCTPIPQGERSELDTEDVVRGVIDQLERADLYTVVLAVGDELELAARSPSGDMAIYVRPPGSAPADTELFDDGGGGLYDLDAEGDLTASMAGTYVVAVTSFDGVVTGYELDAHIR